MKMSSIPNKIFIQVESSQEQQENIKNSRKTLKTIQTTATNKENLVGRLPAYIAKESLIKPLVTTKDDDLKHKKVAPVAVASTSSQTLPASSLITEEDLTSETTVSDAYWEVLAEKRRVALEETLEENEYLHDKCSRLESELNESKQLLEETRDLVSVLTEMLQEKENAENERAEADEETRENQNNHVSAADEALPDTDDDEETSQVRIIHIAGNPEEKSSKSD
uniref:CSON002097 protein n=1 Tax=Culicoides sonorensis TaxID=179676 RepID=A0A336MMU2_CULSO